MIVLVKTRNENFASVNQSTTPLNTTEKKVLDPIVKIDEEKTNVPNGSPSMYKKDKYFQFISALEDINVENVLKEAKDNHDF